LLYAHLRHIGRPGESVVPPQGGHRGRPGPSLPRAAERPGHPGDGTPDNVTPVHPYTKGT